LPHVGPVWLPGFRFAGWRLIEPQALVVDMFMLATGPPDRPALFPIVQKMLFDLVH